MGGRFFTMKTMLLDDNAKKLIEETLKMAFENIIESSSEQINAHIENNVIYDSLTIAESNCGDIVLTRGYVLELTTSEKLSEKIDNILIAHSTTK